jgi:predicted metal-dependent phosphoesterase TrpH
MGKADLHIHTTYSWDGSATVQAILEQAARYAKLDIIAITDHDTLKGAELAVYLGIRFGIAVIPGCEISTADGHLIALFIENPIPAKLPIEVTIEKVAEQNGICIVHHPLALAGPSVGAKKLTQLLKVSQLRETIVGIETVNAGLLHWGSNQAAAQLNKQLMLAEIGSSDSHIRSMVGSGLTLFKGKTPADLKRCLLQRNTQAVNNNQGNRLGYYLIAAYRRLLRKAGWVTWTPSPAGPFTLRPLSEVQKSSGSFNA